MLTAGLFVACQTRSLAFNAHHCCSEWSVNKFDRGYDGRMQAYFEKGRNLDLYKAIEIGGITCRNVEHLLEEWLGYLLQLKAWLLG